MLVRCLGFVEILSSCLEEGTYIAHVIHSLAGPTRHPIGGVSMDPVQGSPVEAGVLKVPGVLTGSQAW